MVAKFARILAIVVISIIFVNIILFISFSIPAVQKHAADFALEKLEPVIGTEARLEGIRIRLFNTVELKGLYVEDQQQDTLLYAGKLTVRIHAMDLLRNKLSVRKVGLENFVADIYRETPDDPFNFQFIIDTFAKEKDTTTVKKEKKSWHIMAEDVELKDGRLSYNILSVPQTPGQFNANHIDVRDLNFSGKADFLSIEDMQAAVRLLSFTENNAGITISDLKADALAKGETITSGKVILALNNTRIEVTGARFNRKTKEFSVKAKSEQTDFKDVAIFSQRFAHLDKPFSFEVDATGQLPMAKINSFSFHYGSGTQIKLSGSVADFSNFNNSDIDLDIRSLEITQDDLEAFIRIGAIQYKSPVQLLALGDIKLQMKAKGKLGYFRYDGSALTQQGDVTMRGTGRMTDSFSRLIFEGPVTAGNIQVANIIGEGPGVGNTTMRAEAKVSVIHNSGVTVVAEGDVESVVFRDYLYNNLHFNGTYSGNNVKGSIFTDTERNKIDLSGDITFGDGLGFVVNGNIGRLDLRPFIDVKGWKDPFISLTIDSDLSGSSIDDMTGTAVIDNISLADSSFIYNPGAVYLQSLPDEGEGKRLKILSSFVEAEVTGDYYFSTIGKELMQVLRHHLPSVITEKENKQDNVPGTEAVRNNFQFNISLNNTEDISYAFSLPFYNVDPATISGKVNMREDESVKIKAYIPRLMFGNKDVRETKIDINNRRSSGMGLNVNSYLVQNSGYVNARLNSTASLDSVVNLLTYDLKQANTRSNGELLVTMAFLRDRNDELASNIRLHPVTVMFNDKKIDLNDATISYHKDRIAINNFGIREQNMLMLGIDGVASRSEADNIRIYFNNTELANILAGFNISRFSGSINGQIFVRQALETPIIRTEGLRIENITVHKDTIGTMRIEGNWDNLYNGLDLNAFLENKNEKKLHITGYIPTGDQSPLPMDVSFKIDEFNLKSIQPLTANIFSELSGHLNSDIHITGKLSEPVTEGWVGIDQGVMKVAYTNVTYHVSDTIEISRDNVGLRNLVIRDQNKHTAILNVNLSHTNFGRVVYNAGIRFNDFTLLNNPGRTDQMVYGTLKLSGELNVAGSPSGIYGDGNLTSSSKSDVMVVLPQTASATEYSGIVYVNSNEKIDSLSFLRKDNTPLDIVNTTTSAGIPILMRATLNLNQLLEMGVVLDPTTGNALEASGEGELNINFNSRSTPQVRLYGDYVIHGGKFHYNLQNLRTIDFNIREGSMLTMEGDPLNTQFNITAYLPVRADLAALSNTFASELANTRVPVNALLLIRGDLEAMDLQYDIELPESSNDIQLRVNSFINNEETKILQFAYLATTGSFIPSEGSSDMNFGSSMFTKFAASTLSKGLDALFAGALSDNWSISTNLESIDGTFDNVRMGVDVSTSLLNDRLHISTNLSYGDKSMLASQQAFMGEFELKYDINNWFMIKAFNRANERFYRRTPTTQGIGVVVTREAKSFRDLFDLRVVRKKEDDE
ncbi:MULTISPECIES: translocation/assembly module TamB domain-containing protein [Proteiniphilum]|uniref:translocation/assembly module TamB domain-containing protein n=1 Tax=Proteiniphilum TaxID=294702 RepID=UPI001EEAC43C|nr:MULTISPECIES: translocation/assembly module TamB domain-containing protein [Proteiniphilum]ULB33307.1 translocation/assembly module TamB domain-containing protein [Proteiniphilum propionicum]